MADSFVSQISHLISRGLNIPFHTFSLFQASGRYLHGILFSNIKPAIDAPAAIAKEPLESRYRLGNDTSAALVLSDGRKLGYAQYGLSTGRPVFYLHGLPGSHIEAEALHELATEQKARIIAVDRPGIGWSSPQPERTLLDHPRDIEYLANHLELDKYGILGISAGGPYALACAAALPATKLKAVSIVCGLGPPEIGMHDMNWANRLGFTFGYRYFPSFVRWYWKSSVASRLDLSDEERLAKVKEQFLQSNAHKKDHEVCKDDDVFRLFLRSARESFAQGFDGILQDGRLICTPFGFDLEQDIRPDLPFQLWYGKLDTFVPVNHGEQIALRLGPRARLRVEDETHASLVANWRRDILRDLLASM